PSSLLYHLDPKNPDAEELGFNSVREYEAFLQKNGLFKKDAPHIIVTGIMGQPFELVAELERQNFVVYHVDDAQEFIAGAHIDSVSPSAMINMAHGRLGDDVVAYLLRQNIPFFAPINVQSERDKWENSKQGLSGGYLSQTVGMPELDGALLPYAVFAHKRDKEGLLQVHAMPDRVKDFATTIRHYVALKSKKNADKRIAVVYYKGPGQSALVAQGMEVVPSLYNFLVRLRREGYNVSGLPASAAELGRLIQSRGGLLGTYDVGKMQTFLQKGQPEMVTRSQFESWVKESLPAEDYKAVVKTYGAFPGKYLSTEDGRLGIPRLRFGNVVIMPQPAAAMGNGVDAVPPHLYLASYLWAQHGFKADALIHFGTHGSLEFTPHKQVALSTHDWADRLVGTMPHFYLYSIANVGEAIIAKRRSYGAIQSYLTAPFMESNLRSTYRDLDKAIQHYNALLWAAASTQQAAGKSAKAPTLNARQQAEVNKASLAVKALTIQMGIHRSLGLDSVRTRPYSEEDIERIEHFAEELSNEKINGRPYVLGEVYTPAHIESSVYAMATDPIAYSQLAIDKLQHRVPADFERRAALFTQKYLVPARQLVGRLLHQEGMVSDQTICQVARITPQQLNEAREVYAALTQPHGGMMAAMMAKGGQKGGMPAMKGKMPAGHSGGMPAAKGDGAAMKGQMPAGHPGAMNGHPGQKMGAAAKIVTDSSVKSADKGKTPASAGHPHGALGMSHGQMPPAMAAAMAQQDKGGKPAAMGHPTTAKGQPNPAKGGGSRAEKMARMRAAMAAMSKQPEYTKEQKAMAYAVAEVERTLRNVQNYRYALLQSPEKELNTLMRSLSGGYTAPSAGGDPIANPNSLPSGRNLYSINAEATPTESAWEKGKQLARNTIEEYRRRHHDSIPRKVSYTFWSSEFIETEGATLAQAFYMLGVEPLRDAFGRVNDLRLIPSKELGRPRIDVVVQTSGQLRDLAASRLFLLQKAVEMAAEAKDDKFENQVASGVVESERLLIEKGISPKEARAWAARRIFGGVNGNYGTGIQEVAMASDKWTDRKQIAEAYLNNMGAFYGDQKQWEDHQSKAFEAALTRTDVVIQPRQNNTWGALSLDHVFEFMGGMNLTVRQVTGKEPDAYLADYRNHNHMRMQEVKEAIGVESRTSMFNPTYLKEQMKGGEGAAAGLEELVQNTFGWEVMKPEAIDNEMWDEIFDTYVKDKHNLGMREYFERVSPAALQDISAIMLESARKGMWKASPDKVKALAKLHTELVAKYDAAGTEFVNDNQKLQQFIASKVSSAEAQAYKDRIDAARNDKSGKGTVLKAEDAAPTSQLTSKGIASGVIVVVAIVVLAAGAIVLVRRRRNKQ
ncbi:MAG: cobaltochelatase subunit CobN, partial [Alloprevotella sp.]|nr:cobaltochelatase subunit CobN [Alloprevotella sp.]